MTPTRILKIGLFGIGLDAYWPQFEGLESRLKDYLARVDSRLRQFQVEVVNLGLIDTPEKALEAGHQFREADVDLILLHVTTYALSSTVLPVVRRARVPVIVLNLAPEQTIDFESFNRLADRTKMTGEWLSFCSACSVPEIANVFNRARIPFHQVTGVLDDDRVWEEIGRQRAAPWPSQRQISGARQGTAGATTLWPSSAPYPPTSFVSFVS